MIDPYNKKIQKINFLPSTFHILYYAIVNDYISIE